MLHASPPAWAHLLPGYGGFRMLSDAILTHGGPQAGPLLAALAWLAGTAAVAAVLFGRNMRTTHDGAAGLADPKVIVSTGASPASKWTMPSVRITPK